MFVAYGNARETARFAKEELLGRRRTGSVARCGRKTDAHKKDFPRNMIATLLRPGFLNFRRSNHVVERDSVSILSTQLSLRWVGL